MLQKLAYTQLRSNIVVEFHHLHTLQNIPTLIRCCKNWKKMRARALLFCAFPLNYTLPKPKRLKAIVLTLVCKFDLFQQVSPRSDHLSTVKAARDEVLVLPEGVQDMNLLSSGRPEESKQQNKLTPARNSHLVVSGYSSVIR
jgi:hypothetical protein